MAALDLMKLKSEEEDKVLNDDNDNRIAVGCKYDNVFAGGHSKKKDKEDDDVDDDDDDESLDLDVIYEDVSMMMKYGDVDDQYEYFLGW